MQALRSLGLLEPMLRVSLNSPNSGFVIWDRDWNEILKLKPKTADPSLPVPSMRIARKALRQILTDAVSPDDVINWGISCTSAAQDKNGKVQVQLSNGDMDDCDILIAADSGDSKIRAARSRRRSGRSCALLLRRCSPSRIRETSSPSCTPTRMAGAGG
jgi:2-polyprenyl-6-methoxyphenol hydroxylase-like FAD-dependent oxidoreductase